MKTSSSSDGDLQSIETADLTDVVGAGEEDQRARYAAKTQAEYYGTQDAMQAIRNKNFQQQWSDDPNERARAMFEANKLSGVRNPAAIDKPVKSGWLSSVLK